MLSQSVATFSFCSCVEEDAIKQKGDQTDVEPQFSPLTPYQTEDSLPPPVYGVLEDGSETIATEKLQVPEQVRSWSKQYGTKITQRSEISPPLYGKSLSSLRSDSEKGKQKSWDIPPGAKLIGYNVQMIAGYIPTVYLNNINQKYGKESWQSEELNPPTDIYMKYRPGYRMNMNYKSNGKNNKVDTVVARTDWPKVNGDGDQLRDESVDKTNFTQKKSRFLEKREDSAVIDKISDTTSATVMDFADFLWPIDGGKTKVQEQNKRSESKSELSLSSTTMGSISFGPSTEANLSNLQQSVDIITTTNVSSRDSRNRLGAEISKNSVSTSTKSISHMISLHDADPTLFNLFHIGKGNSQTGRSITAQNKNELGKNRYDDEVIGNSASVSNKSHGGSRKGLPSLHEFASAKPRMNYTDRLFLSHATLIPEKLSEMQVLRNSRILVPVVVPETITKSKIDRNPFVTEIPIIKEYGRETALNSDGLQDFQITQPASFQKKLLGTVNALKQMIEVDTTSSESEEDYSKTKQNMDGNGGNSFPSSSEGWKLGDSDKSSSRSMNISEKEKGKKIDHHQNLNGTFGYEEPFHGREFSDSDQDSVDELPKRRPMELIDPENQNSDDDNRRKNGNFKDDYGGNDDDNIDDIDSDNDDDDDDDDHPDNPKVEFSGEETFQSQENSENMQSNDGHIFSPGQIPNFVEWLSSLPIQPAFPFNTNSAGIGKLRKDKETQETQNYDDSEEEEGGQFQEYRFMLSKNVPYQL
uniref:Uncharacterized protein n=1 Tax=Setaria digitata TaxID=48799 RepID=A0A915PV40_9BILA